MNTQDTPKKFRQNYVQQGDQKVRVRYHIEEAADVYGNGIPEGLKPGTRLVIIDAKEYGHELDAMFPGIAKNGTDISTDYFEKTRVHIRPEHPDYKAAFETAALVEQKRAAKFEAKAAKDKAANDRIEALGAAAGRIKEKTGVSASMRRDRSSFEASFRGNGWEVMVFAQRWHGIGTSVAINVRPYGKDADRRIVKSDRVKGFESLSPKKAVVEVLRMIEGSDLTANTPEGCPVPVIPEGLATIWADYVEA